MKVISKILNRFGYEKRSNTSSPDKWLVDWVNGGTETSSGVTVNESTALEYSPFWAAVRIISGTLAALPFIVYERKKNGKERVPEHPVYELMHNRPNEYMDALTFIESRQAHVLTYGNGYAEIQRNGAGKPIALWPLLPDRTFRRVTDTGVFYYEVHLPKGGIRTLPDYNVLHIKGLGFDGYTGYNVVTYHKEAIGYGVAVKEYAGRFFSGDASPSGILEHPQHLSDKSLKSLKESWEGGLSKAHRIQILEEGMKWTKVGADPEQAQALEVQKYTVDDCSRIFNIPPHLLSSMEHSTFSNIEFQQIDFATRTMLYWFRKWEQECNYKLFMPSERKTMFCEVLMDVLLRGDTLSRYNAYNIGRNAGFLCVNDIREKENMNTIGEKGNIFLEPLNMKPAGTETPQPAKLQPKPQNEPEDEPEDEPKGKKSRMFVTHRKLIANQWQRVIRRQVSDKTESLRKFALEILFDSAIAYASTLDTNHIDIRSILSDIVNEYVTESKALKENDAEKMADLLINRIGVNNA